MTKDKSKFQLNKGGDQKFDLSKRGKRIFDLRKDDDEDAEVTSASQTDTSDTSDQSDQSDQSGTTEKAQGSKKWLWIILAIIVLAILAWLFIPSSSTTPDEPVLPAETEEVTPTDTTETPVVEEGVVEEEETVVEDVATPGTANPSDEPAAEESNTPEVSVNPAPIPTPPAPPSSVSDDIEQEAMNVIRGNYGVGRERKNRLGSKYQTIQDRVNELKRQGVF